MHACDDDDDASRHPITDRFLAFYQNLGLMI